MNCFMILVSILIYILAMSLSKENQLSSIFLTRIASLVLIYAGALTINALYVQSIGSGIGIYCGLFQITNTTLIIESFFYVIASIILLGWGLIYKVKNKLNLESLNKDTNLNISFLLNSKSNNKENISYINTISISKEARDYSLIALFSILGSSFLISSADILSMYLSLELQSFGLYILASTYRESSDATSAGLKYFLLGILKNLFLLSSVLSLIIGTVVGLAQTKIKRLLAYSTISHIGFLLLALALRTEQATESFIFYLIQYTITNLNTFFILLAFGFVVNSVIKSNYINSDFRYITELKGQFLTNPILSLSLAICLLSMAGIPPLIGFFGKQSVLLSAISNGYYFMAIVAIIVSVISASYYLKIIKEIQTENLSRINVLENIDNKILEDSVRTPNIQDLSIKFSNTREHSENLLVSLKRQDEDYYYIKLSNSHSFIISSFTLIILFFVLKPSVLLNSAMLCTLNYFYL
uniref:NADH-ubiquinone oxidoreductase chain 2 n=1 Tax=Mutinus fleischeri TaxID=2218478 RepID=A0A8K1VCF3_9AGAM|nr:NADH dehydrogenase subunit 2 [Mutinus fleischeri]